MPFISPAALAAPRHVLIVAAHPDDETVGAAGLMHDLLAGGAHVVLLHLTDGAPASDEAAKAHGFATRAAYASARRSELRRALALLPSAPEQVQLPFADRSLSSHLLEVTAAIADVIAGTGASLAFTHAYEGGHPDHDAAALALWAACRLVPAPPRRLEFTSYHLHDGGVRTGVFRETAADAELWLRLDPVAQRAKQRMFAAFATQHATLRFFDAAALERFRHAPAYDFRRPPHEPPLFYDYFPWGLSSAEWLSRAAALLDAAAGVPV